MTRLRIDSFFKITPGLREKHDYRRDKAFDGRYLVRLPDRTLVPAAEYEERLAACERRADGESGRAGNRRGTR